jgi:hypothetical protein
MTDMVQPTRKQRQHWPMAQMPKRWKPKYVSIRVTDEVKRVIEGLQKEIKRRGWRSFGFPEQLEPPSFDEVIAAGLVKLRGCLVDKETELGLQLWEAKVLQHGAMSQNTQDNELMSLRRLLDSLRQFVLSAFPEQGKYCISDQALADNVKLLLACLPRKKV